MNTQEVIKKLQKRFCYYTETHICDHVAQCGACDFITKTVKKLEVTKG